MGIQHKVIWHSEAMLSSLMDIAPRMESFLLSLVKHMHETAQGMMIGV